MKLSQILISSLFSLVFCAMFFSSEWMCVCFFLRFSWKAQEKLDLGNFLICQLALLFCVGLQCWISLAFLFNSSYVILNTLLQWFIMCVVAFNHLLFLKLLEDVREDFSTKFKSVVSWSFSFRTFWIWGCTSSRRPCKRILGSIPPTGAPNPQLHMEQLPLKKT